VEVRTSSWAGSDSAREETEKLESMEKERAWGVTPASNSFSETGGKPDQEL
jgi:hypothetical protein